MYAVFRFLLLGSLLNLCIQFVCSDVYTLPLTEYPNLKVSLGSPPQLFFAFFSFTISETIVIDNNCGRKFKNNCPKYCNNDGFRPLYCDFGCVDLNNAERSLICVDDLYNQKYKSNESSTFYDDGTYWKGQLQYSRHLYGLFAEDTFRMHIFIDNSQRKEHYAMFSVHDLPFVRGFSADAKIFNNFGGNADIIIGLAPGRHKDSLIQHLYKKGMIDEPVISFYLDIKYRKELGYADDYYSIGFGARDEKRCMNWVTTRSTSNDTWSWPVDSVDFGGVHFSKPTKLVFDTQINANNQVPREIINAWKEAGIIAKLEDGYIYLDEKMENQSINLNFGKQSISLAWNTFFCGQTDDGLIRACLTVKDRIEYDYEPQWVLTYTAYSKYCLSLNYKTMEIGMANYTYSSVDGLIKN